jgi:hypothetical protein
VNTGFVPTEKLTELVEVDPLMFESPAYVALTEYVPPTSALLVIEHEALPDPFVVVMHDVEPTWIVTPSPAGMDSPLFEVTVAVNNTEPSLPTAAFDALSETVVWLLSFVMFSERGDDVEPVWLESPE